MAKWRFRGKKKVPEVTVPVPAPRPGPYADFRVLLDSPSDSPGIGFGSYAEALADLIVSSRAEFAVGILGRWGSGKTTLMRAIERRFAGDQTVVTVRFEAWRYEKDPNLILPLLDVLREALEERSWARDAAVLVGQASLAFLEGVTLTAGLPGGVGVGFDFGRTIDAIKAGRERPAPLSRYHAGYRMLSEAISALSAGGTRRVVIFIDDLDRCLPENALDVLESMKLFFDVEGCVFVVGLDREIAEKAVAVKYRRGAGVSGAEYVKKMFQVPFALPPVTAGQLRGYLDAIARDSGFGEAQLKDFTDNVRPHFGRMQGLDPVNPREIKRLVNLYTTQLKILSRRLAGGSPNPNVVLGLLCMNFRDDWRKFYEELAAAPRYFQDALRDALSEQVPEVYLAGEVIPVPTELAEYLGGLASAVLRTHDLAAYISAAESTTTSDPWVLEARNEVSRLRAAGSVFIIGSAERQQIRRHVDRLFSMIGARDEAGGPLGVMRVKLDAAVRELMDVIGGATDVNARWRTEAVPLLDTIDGVLREWYRYISLGQ